MNAGRVPFEAPKERSRVCFGGFRLPARSRFSEGRPDEACGGTTGFSPWGSTSYSLFFYEDAEGFAGEIRPNFFVDDSRFPDKRLITTETFFEVLS